MKNIQFKIMRLFEITEQDIKDIMITALEGGINYWCEEAAIMSDNQGNPIGVSEEDRDKIEYVSDALAYGGCILLFGENADHHHLTLDKLVEGFKKELANENYGSIKDLMDNHDADTADRIVQYAIFNEIVYG